jgi:hypothetical protein
MPLVEIEIGRHRWAEMPLSFRQSRTAEGLPAVLLGLARATTKEEVDACDPSDYLLTGPFLNMPAPAAASTMLAALAEGVSLPARERILNLLLLLVGTEGTAAPPDAGWPDLLGEVLAAVREGLWLLCSEVLNAPSVAAASDAFEIIEVLHEEENAAWFESLRRAAGERIREDLRASSEPRGPGQPSAAG